MMVTMYITSKVDKINMCLSHSSKEWKAEDKGFFKSGSERKQGSLKEWGQVTLNRCLGEIK